MTRLTAVALTALLTPSLGFGQTIGTFRWQLEPFCNVLSLVVTQNSRVFTLDGFDDQCGTTTHAPVTGLATFNPNGTIEFGLTIVVTPDAAPVHVAAAIGLATLGGTWRDSTGATGSLVFTPGAGIGGGPRPAPSVSQAIPSAIRLLADGGLLAGGVLQEGTIPASGAGARMMWYPGKAAFRAGHVTTPAWDDVNVGLQSVAFGADTVARGQRSVAFGERTRAWGFQSVAFGLDTVAGADRSAAFGLGTQASGPDTAAFGHLSVASGLQAFALGDETKATGPVSLAAGQGTEAAGLSSTALGSYTRALGPASFAVGEITVAEGYGAVAMGRRSYAAGDYSIALGYGALTTAAAHASFVFADRSSEDLFPSVGPNTFVVRAAGGVWFYTKADLSTGAHLPEKGNQWLQLSDVHAKEHFRELDDEELLDKIARMPVREWSYKAQGPSIRHIGPTAQDFHAAFGLGEDPLRIGTLDEAGVALAAARALESRTRAADQRNRALEAEVVSLRERLTALERLLAEKR